MEGQVIAERYRLEEMLGRGGMGSVWRARHMTLGTTVAVKIINSELASHARSRARFDREAKLVARIDSVHVVKVLDHGTREDDTSFIVMEHLTGETLADRIHERGRLSPRESARILTHICRGLTKASAAGLVHRDLKPENIFIATLDEDEIVKVLDFGVAKVTDVMAYEGFDPTKTGALIGTPFYMSPEQAKGLKSVDHRADLWSAGIVAFECLTGQRPFSAPSLGTLVAKILMGEIPSPSSIAPDHCTSDIDAWMRKALARDPDERFQSARELGQAFRIACGASDSIEQDAPLDELAQATTVRAAEQDRAVASTVLVGDGAPSTVPPDHDLAVTTEREPSSMRPLTPDAAPSAPEIAAPTELAPTPAALVDPAPATKPSAGLPTPGGWRKSLWLAVIILAVAAALVAALALR